MFKKKVKTEITDQEQERMVKALIEMKNRLPQEGRYTEEESPPNQSLKTA